MVRFVLGLLMTVVCLGIAGRRAYFLYRASARRSSRWRLKAARRPRLGGAGGGR